jgi:hypothetical protein
VKNENRDRRFLLSSMIGIVGLLLALTSGVASASGDGLNRAEA